jgi:hypothetical protein
MPRSYADGRYIRNDTTTSLTAQTTIKSNSNAKLLIQNAVNNSNNFFNVLSYSGSDLFGIDGDGIVRVPRAPSADNHVANKKYVDEQVADAIAALGSNTFPGRRFKFTGYSQQTGVAAGNFSPNNSTDITQNIYFSIEDQDGMRINETQPDFTPGIQMPLTVYKLSGSTWGGVGFGLWGGSSTDYRDDYIKVANVEWKQKPILNSGAIYAIVLGGRW